MPQIHQWLVQQGRLGISSQDQWVSIDVDPEGAEACLLTIQDALEVAGLIATHARDVWERVDQSQRLEQSFQLDGDDGYCWQTEGGVLSISRPMVAPEIRFRYTGSLPCHITVGQAVELVQLLERLANGQGAKA